MLNIIFNWINIKLPVQIGVNVRSRLAHTQTPTHLHTYPRSDTSLTLGHHSDVQGKCAGSRPLKASALRALNNVDVGSLNAPCMSVSQ